MFRAIMCADIVEHLLNPETFEIRDIIVVQLRVKKSEATWPSPVLAYHQNWHILHCHNIQTSPKANYARETARKIDVTAILINSQRPTLPHSQKLPTLNYVLIFQTACEMTSHRCVVAGPVSAKKQLYTTWMLTYFYLCCM